MFYYKNTNESLNDKLFKKPTEEYKGTPFWSWNCKVTRQLIDEQISNYKLMGMGGFHIHPRTGLETPYMGGEYMDLVSYAVERAKREGMYAYLYDEDRYPSGAAGGMVTENLSFRQRCMLLSLKEYTEYEDTKEIFEKKISEGQKPLGYFLATYNVILNEDGYLTEYKRIDKDDEVKKGRKYYAYLKLSKESPWYNDQTYIDVFNKDAVNRFIELTHEKYYKRMSDNFGKTIPSIFTDEPQMAGKFSFTTADSTKDATLSYTDNMDETFYNEYKVHLLDIVPEILWQLPHDKPSINRYHYHDHLAERFAEAFSDTIGTWCEKHNINSTGHFLSERSLYSQTLALSEAMRLYRSFQWPGIDILVDNKEFTTAKQAVSVARQYGREATICEMYGSMNWDFDFKGHKLQGDWLAALGINIRCHHLTFMSMEGEAKRDWPASIGYQSPWYKQYSYVEDHFSRLNTALSRGKADVKIGVIHPIESYWLMYGPNDQTQIKRDQLDNEFLSLSEWLLYGGLDFDYISESLLPGLSDIESINNKFHVGHMNYDAIIIPGMKTIRSTTLDRLEKFRKNGGMILFAGEIPEYVDAVYLDRAKKLAESCTCVSFEKGSILSVLESIRFVDIKNDKGRMSDNLFASVRDDGKRKWLFICHVNNKSNLIDKREKYYVRIKGKWKSTWYDTQTGDINAYQAEYENGYTILKLLCFNHDSFLFRLDEGEQTEGISTVVPAGDLHEIAQPFSVQLEEPNVLLLDYCEVSLNNGHWSKRMDILSADNYLRQILGYPRRQDHFKQPWRIPNKAPKDMVSVKMQFKTSVELTNTLLALERPEQTEIFLNGIKMNSKSTGYYVDKFIKTVALGDIRAGEHEIILRLPFGLKSNLEWCYILGDFAVRVAGSNASIHSWEDKIYYGDLTNQGLPFYSGNVNYKTNIFIPEDKKNIYLCVPHFSAIALNVNVDGEDKGIIAYAPHKLNIGPLSAGDHELTVSSLGSRYNGFAPIHNANNEYKWYGPDSYRTSGYEWSNSYLLKPNGILSGMYLQYK